MNPATLRALELDRILDVLGTFALTPLGRRGIAALGPETEPSQVAQTLALTQEAVAFQDEVGLVPLRATEALDAALAALAVEGRALEPLRLLALADFLGGTARTQALVRHHDRQRWPSLRRLAEALSPFIAEVAAVRDAISDAGDVRDEASDRLRQIRRRLRQQRHSLRHTLDGYVKRRETARYLQEPVVTERHGRFVLMLRAEHRGAVPGLVHGASATGATLFLEPLATVEINNDIVALEEQEAEEIQRILLALADRFRARAPELAHTVDAAGALDVAQARARFSMAINGIVPRLATDGRLELRGARHPLLMSAVRGRLGDSTTAEHQEPVPVDLLVIPPTGVLVVTGPNTGGKTVALKTAGLLALMMQTGLLVPAEAGSALPVFRSIFVDIGDEQSIAANLSTFSGHVTNIAAMDRALVLPGLVLLDELGAGTDPTDGAALGVAVVDHFRQRGALVIVTTHHDQLKSYATTTEGVTAAAFGFDADSFAPTYRLVYGSPGASLALEIARRLGLDPAIVERARQERTGEQAKLADRLARLDHDLQAIDQERRRAARAREEAEASAAAMRAREQTWRDREADLRRRSEATLSARVRAARQEVDRVVADLKARAAELEQDARRRAAPRLVTVTTGDIGRLRRDARREIEALADRALETVPVIGDDRQPSASPEAAAHALAEGGAPAVTWVPRVGDRVMVRSLGVEGRVRALSSRDAEVDIRGKRLRAARRDLRPPATEAPESEARGPDRPTGHVTVTLQSDDTPVSELNVIGCTAEEAVARADKVLDRAVVSGTRVVRLVHGHGMGRLRSALAAFLREHPQVARFGPAGEGLGGKAVTVVEIKE